MIAGDTVMNLVVDKDAFVRQPAPTRNGRMLLKQGPVRVPKDAPIFHDWSFETVLIFDDTVVDFGSLKNIIERSAQYGGFGDFRPTFGRGKAVVTNV